MRVRRPVFLTVTSGFSAALLLTQACAPRKTVKKTETETPQAASAPAVETSAPAAPAGQSGVESGEASVRGTEFEAVSDLQPAYFAYDAYNLDAAARSQLQKNAGYLKAHPDLEVLATGYCDERGTETYNLALGQRRAKSVREYYIRLGVPEADLEPREAEGRAAAYSGPRTRRTAGPDARAPV